jgi:hypothetical protein
MARKINPGDLVRRKYHITLLERKWTELGMVLERDNNGFLRILWGTKVEEMWDDYDLLHVEVD